MKHAHQNSRHVESTPETVTLYILDRESINIEEEGSLKMHHKVHLRK